MSKIALRAAGFALAAAMAGPDFAAEFTVPSSGALYCENSDDITKIVVEATKAQRTGEKPKLPAGCGMLAPGQVGEIVELKRTDGFIGGRLVVKGVSGGRPIAFFAVDKDESDSTKTPPPIPTGPRAYKVVSPADVRNSPEKWQGRDIEFKRVNVYWVGDDDVRFITRELLTLFAVDVKGDPDALSFLRENCETEREALSGKCVVSVKLRYFKHSEDNPGGLFKRTVLLSNDLVVERSERRRRR